MEEEISKRPEKVVNTPPEANPKDGKVSKNEDQSPWWELELWAIEGKVKGNPRRAGEEE